MQYAERLPIGLEKVIRTVSPETVKQFYKKWYHLSNMAVIAVGDFSDTQVWYCRHVNVYFGFIRVVCRKDLLTISLFLSLRM